VPSSNTSQLGISLTWTGSRNDFDLHLRRTADALCSAFDCDFATCTQVGQMNWGTREQSPVLDIDDTAGFGPEHISLPVPADGDYEVAAIYYAANGEGPADVLVQIECGGVQQTPIPRVVNPTQSWDVATVHWLNGACTIDPHSELTLNNTCP
jgi:hypothetical protein